MGALEQEIDAAVAEALGALRASDLGQVLTTDEPWYRLTPSSALPLALFARLAYFTLPEYEVEASGRVGIIPCVGFPEIVRRARSAGIRSTVDIVQSALTRVARRLNDEGESASRVVSTRRVVVLLTRHRDWTAQKDQPKHTIVVTVRGTAALYDWAINLRVLRTRWGPGVRIHAGFLQEAFRVVFRVQAQLLDLNLAESRVVFVGHSLGGAIASLLASMLFDWWEHPFGDFRQASLWGWIGERTHRTSHYGSRRALCVTFGAPRFGNAFGLCRMLAPHHVVNSEDIVPRVPPRWAGYSDGFQVQSLPEGRVAPPVPLPALRWLWGLLRGRCVRQHFIDAYVRLLRDLV